MQEPQRRERPEVQLGGREGAGRTEESGQGPCQQEDRKRSSASRDTPRAGASCSRLSSWVTGRGGECAGIDLPKCAPADFRGI